MGVIYVENESISKLLDVQDFLDIKRLGDMTVHPDGQCLVYVVRSISKKRDQYETDLYRWEKNGLTSFRLTSSGNNSAPRFSPDGQKLAFISSREDDKSQIYVLDLVNGGEAKRIITESAISDFIWQSNSEGLLFSAQDYPYIGDEQWLPYAGAPVEDRERLKKNNIGKVMATKDKDAKPGPRIVTRFSYRRDGVGYLEQTRSQIFKVSLPCDLNSEELPRVEQVTFGDYDHRLGSISPDSKWLVVASLHQQDPELQQRSQLWVYSLTDLTSEPKLLLDAPGPVSSPLWSPQGNHIAFNGHDNSYSVSTLQHLYILSLENVELEKLGEPISWFKAQNITLPFDRSIGGNASELSYGSRQEKVWLGDSLYFLLACGGSGQLYSYENGQSEPVLLSSPEAERTISSIAITEHSLYFIASDALHFDEIYKSVNEETDVEERITSWNETYYDKQLGKVEKRKFKSSKDDQELEGWLTYPSEFDANCKYPLIHMVHGGPHGAYGPGFNFTAQYFAAQGYFVLMLNPRGSTGYGQQFSCIIDKDWGNRDEADLLAGVDDALTTGYINPDLVFLYGWSYGGYAACWLSTQTTKYKAICAGAPVSDLYSDYGTADITMANEWEYGGQPWKDAAGLHSRSALAHVEKVSTPVLLLHGEADMRCPIIQSEQFYTALKRLGKTVAMVRYPGEMHGLRQPAHLIDRYQRLLAWFNYYCQGVKE